MIRFQDGEPVGIYYSQHRDGAAYDWNDERISKTGVRVRATFYDRRAACLIACIAHRL